ncbi:serine protease [Corallincola platygyrae]|uniref:Serine protease n=1 Tax=Corallincola platygyrae TaxID=1193278 RepID=A0ABW4XSC9_9GAMM
MTRVYSKVISALAASSLLVFSSAYAAPDKARSAKPTPKIIDGTLSPQGQWPFMTALVRGDDQISVWNGQFCGGSFIGDRYILTAAHCVIDEAPEDIDVVIGVQDLTSQQAEQSRLPVRAIYLHADYDQVTLQNDIAVLELQASQDLPAVSLATNTDLANLNLGELLTAMGWGNQQPDSSLQPIYPDALFEVELPYVSRYECQDQGGDFAQIGEETICAGYGPNSFRQEDTCQGDSGGPLVAGGASEPVLVGLTSWGDGCGQAYGAYTNVAHFSTWLEKVTSDLRFMPFEQLGYVAQGTYQHSFTLLNDDSVAIDVQSVSVAQRNLSNVVTVSDSCSLASNGGQALAAGEQCEVVVEYTVSVAGESELEVTFETNHPQAGTVNSLVRMSVLIEEATDIGAYVDSALGDWFSSDYPWQVQTTDSTVGNTGLMAGSISDGQESVLAVKVAGTGTLTFDYRVSSEEDYDFFYVYVNESTELTRSGIDSGFRSFSITLDEAETLVQFVYSKDASVSEGADTVYIDNIRFTSDNEQPETPPVDNDDSDVVETSGGGGGGSTGFPLLFLLGFVLLVRNSLVKGAN